MIYTVTFNPSLDYIVSVEDFRLGRTNRTKTEQMYAGGKGINVSMVLNHLGMENTALGFLAGFTGEEIQKKVAESGCHTDFITVPDGISRINMKLKNIDGTEINGQGPDIPKEKVRELYEKLERLVFGDVLVLAGSIPKTMPKDIYRSILQTLDGRGISIVVDATRELLTNVLEFHPFLIKPNNHELGEIFHREFTSRDQVIPYAKKLQERGAENVLVSMGGKGAVLAAADGQCYEAPAPKGTLVNAVGAGDSMVAGFLTGWLEQKDYGHAFKMGIAAGSASAFSEKLATRPEVMAIYRTL
ncbi:MAG: 1-phosphofructokinase [Blautia sp.]|jgi:1-phosphofructokinase